MIKIFNEATGEMSRIWHVSYETETICKRGDMGKASSAFFEKYPMLTLSGTSEDGCELYALGDGWTAVKGRRKTGTTPRSRLATQKKRAAHKSGDEVVSQAISEAKETAKETKPKNGQHPLMPRLLALVKNDRTIGRFPWLYGPAGSGKSTIASQVAEAMGLPFYSVSSLQQKYELEGYTDAAGELVETTFYKAATEGGIFLLDEVATTSPEVQVAFNSMLANLVYNFPKTGMVKAHPDFHIIAADNTNGRGADGTYTTRFALDASTLDRYTFIKVDYLEDVEMSVSHNDADLVAFFHDLRKVLADAQLAYLATPRAEKAAKAFEEKMATEPDICNDLAEAIFLAVCSGWDKQDYITVAAQMDKSRTRWHEAFQDAKKYVK